MSRSSAEAARQYCAATPLLLAALSACTAGPLPEGGSRINYGQQLEFGVPVTSLVGRRFETVVRQQFDFSCGSAALATLLTYHYDDPQNERTVFVGMFRDGDQAQIRRLGFSLLDMKRYLAARGVAADGYQVSIQQIRQAGIPGVALIDFNGYKHFVVVKGVVGDSVVIGDPSLGIRREDVATFARQWNGVFFVINGRNDIARRHFNQGADLERAPGGRFYPEAQPLSLSGLELTRPFTLPQPFPAEF